MCASKVRMELNISTSQKYMGFLAEVHGLIGEFAVVCGGFENDARGVHLLSCDGHTGFQLQRFHRTWTKLWGPRLRSGCL